MEPNLDTSAVPHPFPEAPILTLETPEEQLLGESAEHLEIGDAATLRFSAGDPGREARHTPLRLPNGLALTYGQLMLLGGDFYAIPKEPIADGRAPAERRQRFQKAFDSLAVERASVAEAQKILEVLKREVAAVGRALADGLQPSVAYAALGDSLSYEWLRIIGSRYLEIAFTNVDHMGSDAILAYQAGHGAALDQALAARAIADPERRRDALELAYAIDGFANHYLSDLFSAGHVRTPRRRLGSIAGSPLRIGDQLARYMHDEDSRWGLTVRNRRGESWKAFGDKRFFDTVSRENLRRAREAVQTSADEVLDAFLHGRVPQPGDYAALALAPDPTSMDAPGSHAAMFVWDGSTLLCRQDLNDLDRREWTRNWAGLSTLLWLRARYNPRSPASQVIPPGSVPTIDPNGWRRREPLRPRWVPGRRVRYVVAFIDGLDESEPGPWMQWTTLQDRFCPTLVNVPVDPTGRAKARRLYRQFDGEAFTWVGDLAGNTATTFADEQP